MPVLETKLLESKTRLCFLVDYMTFSPVDMRLNRQPFQWQSRMPSVFEEHQKIVTEKTGQYQEGLKVKCQPYNFTFNISDCSIYSLLQNSDTITIFQMNKPTYEWAIQTKITIIIIVSTSLSSSSFCSCGAQGLWKSWRAIPNKWKSLSPLEIFLTSTSTWKRHRLWMPNWMLPLKK